MKRRSVLKVVVAAPVAVALPGVAVASQLPQTRGSGQVWVWMAGRFVLHGREEIRKGMLYLHTWGHDLSWGQLYWALQDAQCITCVYKSAPPTRAWLLTSRPLQGRSHSTPVFDVLDINRAAYFDRDAERMMCSWNPQDRDAIIEMARNDFPQRYVNCKCGKFMPADKTMACCRVQV